LPRLDHFLIGMMTAKFVAHVELKTLNIDRFGGVTRVGALAGVLALLLGTVACMAMAQDWYMPGNAAWLFTRMVFAVAVACSIIFLLYARKTIVHQVACWRVAVWLGLAGYSAFMWHTVVALVLSRIPFYAMLIPPDRLKLLLTLGLGLTLMVTALSFLILELPFMSGQSRKKVQAVTQNSVTLAQRL
jgi:peptidoglycan/LPS O-acetylase OafA/YrhL